MQNLSCFLGSNSCNGFYSLFNELYNPENEWKMYIIKGGPGTGKSSLMKKIITEAENRNLFCEKIHCSSDPSSIDAVIIPELKISIADGTSPHTIEPVYPGVCEEIINLGSCWNTESLKTNSDKIKEITKINSYWHKKSVKYIRASMIIDKEIENILNPIFNKDKADRFIIRYSKLLIKTNNDSNKTNRRFLSAITPEGISVHYDSFFNSDDNIIIIKDTTSIVSNYIINQIKNIADKKGIDKNVYLCPTNPETKTEHIKFYNSGSGIYTANNYHTAPDKKYKTINAERFYNKDEYNKIKNKIRFFNKAKAELISEAFNCLKQAKSTHDILESYYIAAMDFNKVSKITESTIKKIFNM